MTMLDGGLSLSSKEWCVISTAALVADISALKFEQTAPQGSLNWFLSVLVCNKYKV